MNLIRLWNYFYVKIVVSNVFYRINTLWTDALNTEDYRFTFIKS
jgi:hypothetical protein